MSFMHMIIKIRYSRDGYLPDLPYHLISEGEMCDAFLPVDVDAIGQEPESTCCCPCCESDEDDIDTSLEGRIKSYWNSLDYISCYFMDMYPLYEDKLKDEYDALACSIIYQIYQFKTSIEDDRELPRWVYSYMLGATIGPESRELSRHNLFVLLDTDNLYDEFDYSCGKECFNVSGAWIAKISGTEADHRVPTIFGEPCVVKSLRLRQANIEAGNE